MIGVILANTGSPADPEPDAIEAYLREYLMDDRIRQMPKPMWKWLLTKHILPKRKFSSAQRYRFIWTDEGSPLVSNARELARKVELLFARDGSRQEGVIVRSAMSYGSPSMGEVLEDFRTRGIDRIVLLPLYPQSAYSPTLAVVDAFERARKALSWHPDSCVIDNYHDDRRYIKAIADSIRKCGYDAAAGDKLVLSFHAIPLKDEKAGDTYRVQIGDSVRLIAEELDIGADEVTVSFQSVFGHDKSKWTGPLSVDILAGWRAGDFRVVYACPGFSLDCLETLYDIPWVMVTALEGEDAKPVVSKAGDDVQAACNTSGRFVWVPSLNTSDAHAEVIKGIVSDALGR